MHIHIHLSWSLFLTCRKITIIFYNAHGFMVCRTFVVIWEIKETCLLGLAHRNECVSATFPCSSETVVCEQRTTLLSSNMMSLTTPYMYFVSSGKPPTPWASTNIHCSTEDDTVASHFSLQAVTLPFQWRTSVLAQMLMVPHHQSRLHTFTFPQTRESTTGTFIRVWWLRLSLH